MERAPAAPRAVGALSLSGRSGPRPTSTEEAGYLSGTGNPAMTAQDILDRFADRYSVSPQYGKRFLPLVGRSLSASPEIRARILSLIERSFRREEERLQLRRQALVSGPEWKMVRAVAGILHAWEPPEWLMSWGELRGPEPS